MPPKNENKDGLKAGSAAPLKGAVGGEIAGLLNTTMAVATMGLVYDATLKAGLQLEPVLGRAPAAAAPQMAKTPNPFEMKMPKLEMGKPK